MVLPIVCGDQPIALAIVCGILRFLLGSLTNSLTKCNPLLALDILFHDKRHLARFISYGIAELDLYLFPIYLYIIYAYI